MSDNPLGDLIRVQQSGLLGLQSQRITQLEAELRKANKRIKELEAQATKASLIDRLIKFAEGRGADGRVVLAKAQELRLQGKTDDEIIKALEQEANC